MSPFGTILVCLASWTIAWGFFAYFFWLRGVDYVHGYLRTTLYFLAVGIGIASLFRNTVVPTLYPIAWNALAVLVIFMIFQVFLYQYFPQIIRIDTAYL